MIANCSDAADRLGLQWFFASADTYHITAAISRRAQRILESLAPPSPLMADEAIVAATAIEHKLTLYTLDPPKYAGVAGLTVLQPY